MKPTDGYTSDEWHVAKALYAHEQERHQILGVAWDDTPSFQKRHWLDMAHVAVTSHNQVIDQPASDEDYVPNQNTVRISMEDWRKLNRGLK